MGMPGKADGAIKSANLDDDSGIQPIVRPGAAGTNTPKQLAVEPRGKKLYFCDREGQRALRCGYDGAGLETLVQTGDWEAEGFADKTKCCVGIAVSRKLGKFIGRRRTRPRLARGASCVRLPEPIDLEVDDAGGFLYWSDRGELPFGNSVNRARLDPGSGLVVRSEGGPLPYEVLVRHLNEAIGLKLDLEAGHMYLVDLGGSVLRCNLDGSEKRKIYSSHDQALTGMAIV